MDRVSSDSIPPSLRPANEKPRRLGTVELRAVLCSFLVAIRTGRIPRSAKALSHRIFA
jgi:hypothetical protein